MSYAKNFKGPVKYIACLNKPYKNMILLLRDVLKKRIIN